MKRILIASAVAVASLVTSTGQAKAQGGCGFGIGIGINFSFNCWKNRCTPPNYCCPPACGMPFGGMPGCGPTMSYAAMPGLGGPALAGYPGFPSFGGYPMMGGPDLGVMRPDLAALAFAGAPGYAGYPTLVASPMMGGYPGMGGLPAFAGMPAYGNMGGEAFNPAFAHAYHPAFGGFSPYGGLPAFGGHPTGMAWGYPIPADETLPVEEKKTAATTETTPTLPLNVLAAAEE